MARSLFQGELVRLSAVEEETDPELYAQWSEDALFWRLLSTDPIRPKNPRKLREELLKMQSKPGEYAFGIRTLTENKTIGFCGLECVTLPHGEGVLGIGIGDRNYWGKGYGTDAIRVLLRFGFMDCNLHRVGLNVFEYNNRALASYRKIGFQEEGRVRSYIQRDGKRWDLIYMAMLRSEWDHNQVV